MATNEETGDESSDVADESVSVFDDPMAAEALAGNWGKVMYYTEYGGVAQPDEEATATSECASTGADHADASSQRGRGRMNNILDALHDRKVTREEDLAPGSQSRLTLLGQSAIRRDRSRAESHDSYSSLASNDSAAEELAATLRRFQDFKETLVDALEDLASAKKDFDEVPVLYTKSKQSDAQIEIFALQNEKTTRALHDMQIATDGVVKSILATNKRRHERRKREREKRKPSRASGQAGSRPSVGQSGSQVRSKVPSRAFHIDTAADFGPTLAQGHFPAEAAGSETDSGQSEASFKTAQSSDSQYSTSSEESLESVPFLRQRSWKWRDFYGENDSNVPERVLGKPCLQPARAHPRKGEYLRNDLAGQSQEVQIDGLCLEAQIEFNKKNWLRSIDASAAAVHLADEFFPDYPPLTGRCKYWLAIAYYRRGDNEDVEYAQEKIVEAEICIGHYREGELIPEWKQTIFERAPPKVVDRAALGARIADLLARGQAQESELSKSKAERERKDKKPGRVIVARAKTDTKRDFAFAAAKDAGPPSVPSLELLGTPTLEDLEALCRRPETKVPLEGPGTEVVDTASSVEHSTTAKTEPAHPSSQTDRTQPPDAPQVPRQRSVSFLEPAQPERSSNKRSLLLHTAQTRSSPPSTPELEQAQTSPQPSPLPTPGYSNPRGSRSARSHTLPSGEFWGSPCTLLPSLTPNDISSASDRPHGTYPSTRPVTAPARGRALTQAHQGVVGLARRNTGFGTPQLAPLSRRSLMEFSKIYQYERARSLDVSVYEVSGHDREMDMQNWLGNSPSWSKTIEDEPVDAGSMRNQNGELMSEEYAEAVKDNDGYSGNDNRSTSNESGQQSDGTLAWRSRAMVASEEIQEATGVD